MVVLAVVLALFGGIVFVQLGAVSHGLGRFIAGAATGLLFFAWLRLHERLQRVETRLQALERRPLQELPTGDTPSAAVPDAVSSAATSTADSKQDSTGHRPTPTPASFPAPAAKPRSARTPSSSIQTADLKRWLIGDNPAARIGVVLFLIGATLLIGYGVEQGLLTLSVRRGLIMAAGIGLTALVFGYRQEVSRPGFARALQGGGLGLLFITVFAAHGVFGEISALTGFLLLVVVATSGVLQALRLNAPWLAWLAMAGGLAAPLLSGQINQPPAQLFAYYLLINIAIAVIAAGKRWRSLNLLGLFATLVVAVVWGEQHYQSAHASLLKVYLLAFWALYIFIAWRFAERRLSDSRSWLDATLVFLPPLAAFSFLNQILAQHAPSLAVVALAAAIVYAALAAWRWRTHRCDPTLLLHAWAALSVGFFTVAVPLAFSAHWSALIWAVQGGAMVWIGRLQAQSLTRGAGVALVLLSVIALIDSSGWQAAERALLHADMLAALVVALAMAFSAIQLHLLARQAQHRRAVLPAGLFLLAWLFLNAWLLFDLAGHHHGFRLVHSLTLACLLTAVPGTLLARRIAWQVLLWPTLAALAALLLLSLGHGLHGGLGLFADQGLIWSASLLTGLGLLALLIAPSPWPHLNALAHGLLGVSLLIGLLAEIAYWLPGNWAFVLSGLCLSAIALGLAQWQATTFWPIRAAAPAWQHGVRGVSLFFLVLWLLASLESSRQPPVLDWLPLLNPLDMVCLLGLTSLALGLPQPSLQAFRALLVSLLGWLVLSAITIRTAHHWFAAPITFPQWFASMSTQTSLSVSWGLAAVMAMITAHRLGKRAAWIAGACLMGLVIAKLLLVDVSGQGTLARVVSFIGVGLLLLALGYIAPKPPSATQGADR